MLRRWSASSWRHKDNNLDHFTTHCNSIWRTQTNQKTAMVSSMMSWLQPDGGPSMPWAPCFIPSLSHNTCWSRGGTTDFSLKSHGPKEDLGCFAASRRMLGSRSWQVILSRASPEKLSKTSSFLCEAAVYYRLFGTHFIISVVCAHKPIVGGDRLVGSQPPSCSAPK